MEPAQVHWSNVYLCICAHMGLSSGVNNYKFWVCRTFPFVVILVSEPPNSKAVEMWACGLMLTVLVCDQAEKQMNKRSKKGGT